MLTLNLPKFQVKVTREAGKLFIWDEIRKKSVKLTPEEWVRQHFVHYLVKQKNYPLALVANEVSISLNGTSKRCDTVVYNRFLEPLAIVEYKAPHINITSAVFDQIAHYNMVLRVRYLIVSNGFSHFCCKINYEDQTYNFLPEIPAYHLLEKEKSDE